MTSLVSERYTVFLFIIKIIFYFFYDSTGTRNCNLILGLFIFMKAILLYKSMFYTQVLGGNRFLFLTSNACRHPMHSYKNNPTLLYLRWHLICSNQFYKQQNIAIVSP